MSEKQDSEKTSSHFKNIMENSNLDDAEAMFFAREEAKELAICNQLQAFSNQLRAATTLITGFPGFLTRNLLIRLLKQQSPQTTFYLLVEKKHRRYAQRRLDECLARVRGKFQGTIEIIDGDITQLKLGLSDELHEKLINEVQVVWHLAAIYDLSVREDVAYKINVLGTFYVLDFCEKCKNLLRLNYISTCYVSGCREGLILETELDCGQEHNNHYESTKFWAEVEVQRRSETLPTVIFRPAIVVGDSTTGDTDKYDGPYYLFKLFKNLPKWLPLPNIKANGAVVNLVPVNFVADAMAHLGLHPSSHGVYQLADHRPLTVPEILEESMKVFGGLMLPSIVPSKLVDYALSVEPIENLVKIPHEVANYFSHKGKYDTLRTRAALTDTIIECPDLRNYIDVLIDYMEDHPDKTFLDDRKR